MKWRWWILVLLAACVVVAAWMLGHPSANTSIAPAIVEPAAGAASRASSRAVAESRPAAPRSFHGPEAPATFDPILVRVVDSEGRPVGGVGVLLVEKSGKGWGWARAVSRTTAGSGLAEVRAEARWMQPAPEPAGWFVTVDVPLAAPPEAPVDPANPPKDAVTLALGATGRVVVHVVDPQKNLVREPIRIALVVDRENTLYPPLEGWIRTDRGEVAFEKVGVGIDLIAEAAADGRRYLAVSRGPGPRAPGEAAELTVTMESKPFVVGRFVDPERKPIASQSIVGTIVVAGDSRRNTIKIDTDASGRFRTEIIEDLPAGGGDRHVDLLHESGGRPDLEAVLDLSHVLTSGDNEVGDVVFSEWKPPPLLAAGIVLDDSERPIAEARVRVEGRERPRPEARSAASWNAIPELPDAVRTDDRGHFEIRAATGLPELRINAWKSGFWGDNPVEFESVRTDVVLHLHAAGSLAGSVRLPSGVERRTIRITARLESTDSEWKANGTGYWTNPDGDGAFEFRDLLRSGFFTVTVEPEGDLFLPVTIKGIEVRAGEVGRDPRLQGVEIPSRGKLVVLTVVGSDGQPVADAEAAISGSARMGHKALNEIIHAQEGRIRLFVHDAPLDVVVGASGFRRRLVGGIRDDQTVVLDAGIPVRLVLKAETLPKTDAVLEGSLSFAGVALSDARPEDLAGRIARGRFDPTTRTAEIRVPEPGLYWIGIMLSRTIENTLHLCSLDLVPPKLVVIESATTPEFEVVATPESVEKAIRVVGQK